MRKLIILAFAIVMFATASERSARADVGIGAFIGRPTGLDVKLGLARRSSLDILVGWYSDYLHCLDCGAYGHVTYLLTPIVGQGQSVNVPVRIGIGGAIYDTNGRFNDNLHLAVRFPGEIAIAFRRTPLEIYFELALKVTFFQDTKNVDPVTLDGGLGLRFYF